jgi:SPP1 family predicted phage head-tail adaptor
MIARQYTRKIKIYKLDSVADGYGGNTVTDILIGSFWAEVKQNSAFKDNSVGFSSIKNNYSFKIRTTDKITESIDRLYIVYRNKKYVVNDVIYNDEFFREINITANGIEGN